MAAWGRAEIITFGPVAVENRFERMFYWPDRKSIGARQVSRILAKRDPRVLDTSKLARKSVAVQGLSAMELLLYGSRASALTAHTADDFACRYALSIADNLMAMNAAVLKGWRDGGTFAQVWRSPGRNNPAYLSSKETSFELVKAFDQGLERVRDERLAPPLGIGIKRKKRPVLWRSKLSMVLIHANIAGLRDLLFQSGLAETYIASRPGQEDQVKAQLSSIESEFLLTLRMSEELAGEADPFALPDIQSRLIPLGFPLKNIRVNTVGPIKAAAGLSLGFNASDGD